MSVENTSPTKDAADQKFYPRRENPRTPITHVLLPNRFQKLMELKRKQNSTPSSSKHGKTLKTLAEITPKNNLKQRPVKKASLKHAEPITEQSVSASMSKAYIERLVEQNIGLLHHVRGIVDKDLNRLIRKLTISFRARKNESSFVIGDGIFEDAKFHVKIDKRDLVLHVGDAKDHSQALLKNNIHLLKNRLADNEINLRELRFIS